MAKHEFGNARIARNEIREIYGRYVLGKDRYPKARIVGPEEAVSARVRPAASLLIKAWEIIDLDNEYFWDMISRAAEAFQQSPDQPDTAGLVVAKSGRNAVHLGKVSLRQGEVSVVHGTFTPREARDLVNHTNLVAPDGNPIHFTESGSLEVPPIPDAVILRDRPDGLASVFGDFPNLLQAA